MSIIHAGIDDTDGYTLAKPALFVHLQDSGISVCGVLLIRLGGSVHAFNLVFRQSNPADLLDGLDFRENCNVLFGDGS